MGISLTEALENNIVSDRIIKLLPKKCLYGNEIVFSDSLKGIECTKSDCKCRIIYRVKHFCNEINTKISVNDIKNIVDKLNIISPYQMLLLDEAYSNNMITSVDSSCIEELVQNIKNIKSNEYFLYEIIKLSGIEKLVPIAYDIAHGFENIDELYNELEIGQLSFINERLGITSSDSCILSLDILSSLLDIKEELIFAESILKLRKYSNERLFIAFNDNAEPYINKQEAIDILTNKFNKVFVHVNIISNNTDILVKNFESATNKFRAARLVNDKLIAEQINIGNIELNEVGKFKDKMFKPVGSKIYIGSIGSIVDRLEYIKE